MLSVTRQSELAATDRRISPGGKAAVLDLTGAWDGGRQSVRPVTSDLSICPAVWAGAREISPGAISFDAGRPAPTGRKQSAQKPKNCASYKRRVASSA